MKNTYWYKQTKNQPLYPDLLWSKPENRLLAGKLLIVGGNLHAFTAPSEAYIQAQKTGAGQIRLILPESIKKTVSSILPEAVFAQSTLSGSLSKHSLSTLIDNGSWADEILLAGDFGKNSETSILLEQFALNSQTHKTIVGDTVDCLLEVLPPLMKSSTNFVVNLSQLQKISKNLKFEYAFISTMPIHQLVNQLHIFTLKYKASIITVFETNYIVAKSGNVSTTKISNHNLTDTALASHISVWNMQNPNNTFKASTTAFLDLL